MDQGKTSSDFQCARDPHYCHLKSELKIEVNQRTLRVAPHILDLLQVEVDLSLYFEDDIKYEDSGSIDYIPFADME